MWMKIIPLLVATVALQAQGLPAQSVQSSPSPQTHAIGYHYIGETFNDWLLAENLSIESVCSTKGQKKDCSTLKRIRFDKKGEYTDSNGVRWTFSKGVVTNAVPYSAVEGHQRSMVKIYLQPQSGYESFIAAAFITKKLPVTVTQNEADAQYTLTSVFLAKEESTGGKIARCIFMYCSGIDGIQAATVELLTPNKEVVWAYNVRKAGANSYQSTAEAIAKHLLNEFFENPSEKLKKQHQH
jgi:hypothetical protein